MSNPTTAFNAPTILGQNRGTVHPMVPVKGTRMTVGTPGVFEGPWVVHAQVRRNGTYIDDRWQVSSFETGECARGGFTSEGAAQEWAVNSGVSKPYGGDLRLLEVLTVTPSHDVQNMFDITSKSWIFARNVVGAKLRDYWRSVAVAVLRGEPIPKRRSRVQEGIAVNAYDANLKRGFTYTAENLLRRGIMDAADECTGACRCRIEQDGCCSKGWPSRSVAAKLI